MKNASGRSEPSWGHLASDHADSPHLIARRIKGRLYVGDAGINASFPPLQSTRLAEALRVACVDYIIENYAGRAHGWTVPDYPVFNPAGAERHWRRLLALFDETLTG
jgi:carboxymethylenebutenolidase